MENIHYTSLLEIRERKIELQKQLSKSGENVHKMWNELFHRPKLSTMSTTQKTMSLITSSAGLIDGLILGWKLYRKFRKH